MAENQCRYYATPSPTSDLSRHARVLRLFRGTAEESGRWARNVVLHVTDIPKLGLRFTADRLREEGTRSAAKIADHVMALSTAQFAVPRQPEECMIGNCYHLALLSCALLRHVGVPVRVRYGFVPYFKPGHYDDHCICEIFSEGRWWRFDPGQGFEIGDARVDEFISGGEAWRRCRSREADPELFGNYEWRGMWFIRNNVVRDFAALCRVELNPWDWWGLMLADDAERPPELIDEIAALACDDDAFAERAARFGSDPMLKAGGKIMSFDGVGGLAETVLPLQW